MRNKFTRQWKTSQIGKTKPTDILSLYFYGLDLIHKYLLYIILWVCLATKMASSLCTEMEMKASDLKLVCLCIGNL